MKLMSFLVLLPAVLGALSCKNENNPPENPFLNNPDHKYEIVRINTDFGAMRLWLSFQTPLHRENFLKLVTEGFYTGLTFHRIINDFVVQGGDPNGDGTGGPGYVIPAELETKLRHRFGAVAAARLGDAINPRRRSSGSQFYIVENRNGTPNLNGAYTVFGQLVEGYDVLELLGSTPIYPSTDIPLRPVYMRTVTIEFYTRAELLEQFEFDIQDY
jgi:cyclophilin family peptidyl-prolyl cis-trans isomerase